MIYFGGVVVNMRAKSKGRPRFSKHGHAYTDKATRDYELKVREYAEVSFDEPTDKALFAVANLYEAVPKSWPKWKYEQAIHGLMFPQRGDADNKMKALLDGCNGIAYLDDKQLMGHFVTQHFAVVPRWELRLYIVGDAVDQRDKIRYDDPTSCFRVG